MKKKMIGAAAIFAMTLGISAPSASAHTAGAKQPSEVFVTSFGTTWGTYADDNVTDGHCVYVSYFQANVTRTDGAKSCGPPVNKNTNSASTVWYADLCITGHWSCHQRIWHPNVI